MVDSEMTDLHEELLGIAKELEKLTVQGRELEIRGPLNRLLQAAGEVGKAWCGSWRGYHANVYYIDLQTPPKGRQFMGKWNRGQDTGEWVEFNSETVIAAIMVNAENPDVRSAHLFDCEASSAFESSKFALLSSLELAIEGQGSPLLSEIRDKVSALALCSKEALVRNWMSDSSLSTFIVDSRNYNQNPQTPPHYLVLGEVQAIQYTLNMVQQLGTLTRQTAVYIRHRAHQNQRTTNKPYQGTRIFIGHGHSHVWWELKDFLKNTLSLAVDEFNRVPVAGVSNTDRLNKMLDSAIFAFLVMTGEDEQPSGELRPRENVVHEAGLFQGHLGFERAIVLLEEGCEKFSNNAGLGHINFPKGNIRAAFQDIREVLEREGILNGGNIPRGTQ